MDAPLSPGDAGHTLRVGFVPGVQPDKWVRRRRERRPDGAMTTRVDAAPLAGLAAGDYDVVFVRERESDPRRAPEGLLRIPLYTETMAVLAGREHEIGAFARLDLADLDGERWVDPVDPISAGSEEVAAAVDLVAAGVGVLVLPLPYARHLGRRDVLARELTGVPATRIGVAWSPEREGDDEIDHFVGIVRGRTAGSSRGGDAAVEARGEAAASGGSSPSRSSSPGASARSGRTSDSRRSTGARPRTGSAKGAASRRGRPRRR